MPSAFKSSPRHTINVKDNGSMEEAAAALSRRPSIDLGYDEDAFTRLKVAQDSLIEDLECKIVVSSVVGQSVLRGMARALSDEAMELVSQKNADVGRLENEKKMLAAEFLEKIKDSESSLLEKERDLSKMAETLIDLTFRLQGESLNNGVLEKKIKDLAARDSSKQRKINALTEEVENLKMEREMLKSEVRIKSARHSDQIDEVCAENEARLAALRAENLEHLSTISALEKVNEEVCQMIEDQKESLEAMEDLRQRLEEQRCSHDREIEEQRSRYELETNIVMELYESQVEELSCCTELEDLRHRLEEQRFLYEQGIEEQRSRYEQEMSIVMELYESQVGEMSYCGKLEDRAEVDGQGFEADKQRDLDEITKIAMDELEKDIILDCFAGFSEDAKESADSDPGKIQSMRFRNVLAGWRGSRSEFQKYVRYCKSRRRDRHGSGIQEQILEQHHRHQLEMDVLLEFFVGKLQELSASDLGFFDADANLPGDRTVAELQRENATLRREKDQVLVDKTEELFRLKRDFFKELDNLKLEGGQYESGILKKQFPDSRQKLERILPTPSRIDEQSDADSLGSSGSESFTNDYGGFTEELPELVSELQNDIEQLILDTGMAKPEDRTDSDIQQDLDALNLEYASVLERLEDEKQQNVALTVELQELEHNINLSNGELERLLKQIESEKQARMIKEGDLQNMQKDAMLIKRQLDTVLVQLENERAHKIRIESELELAGHRFESLQKELGDVLKVKSSIAEDHKRLRSEVIVMHRGIAEIRSEMPKVIEKQVKTMIDKFATMRRTLEQKESRMVKLNDRVKFLGKFAKAKDLDRRRKLSNYLKNLHKAEEEVDLLGDENDNLVNLLERVFQALEHYSAALRHYPGITDLMKVIKEELMGRVEH